MGSIERTVARLAERMYRRWPRLVRSVAGAPVRFVLARALLRSGAFDAERHAIDTNQATPSRSAGRRLREAPPRDGDDRDAAAALADVEAYRAAHALPPGTDLLVHFATRRDAERRVAGGFDGRAYLDANPDLRVARADPLRHFLTRGRDEGRRIPPGTIGIDSSGVDFTDLVARRVQAKMSSAPTIRVVVPVHGARDETLRCLWHVLTARTEHGVDLVVIDDASPDERLAAELVALRDAGLIDLLVNPRNLGFAATINRAIATLPEGRDVVFLNSDTEVFDGWLDRLHGVAHGGTRIGTVTPLSNSATILSYPIRLKDNPLAIEAGWDEIDRIAARLDHAPIALPTAIGFCMYVRWDCIAQTGPFDADAFPRGYGEENDFCLRAAAAGWRHLAATNVFVAHRGSASFRGERAMLIEAGLRTVERRYPGYRAAVDAFIRADPLAAVRRAIDCARIRQTGLDRILYHGLEPPDWDRPGLRLLLDPADGTMRIRCDDVPVTPNLPVIATRTPPAAVAALLRDLGVSRVYLADPAWLGARRVALLRAAASLAGIVAN